MAHAHSYPHEHSHAHEPGHAHSHAQGGHSHLHGHGHGPKSYGRAFAIGVTLNLAFVIVEVFYGVVSHSVALLSDAGHNFGDVLGLGFAWGASALANVRPSARRTFGYRRSTIVASMANALLLLVVTGGLAWESIRRLFDPPPAQGKTMIVVALVGAVINLGSALLFMREDKDLNVKSAFVHLASDAVLALGVAAT
ncbi:MAG TPA: cation diffusion facilitator family transporter, partial [Polyangiaceae bacterium]